MSLDQTGMAEHVRQLQTTASISGLIDKNNGGTKMKAMGTLEQGQA